MLVVAACLVARLWAFSTPRLMLLLTSKSLEKEEEIQSQWRAQWPAYDSDLVIPSSYRHRRCGGLFGVSKWNSARALTASTRTRRAVPSTKLLVLLLTLT